MNEIEKYLFDIKEDFTSLIDDYNVKISPFLTVPIMSGDLHMMFQATVSDFKSGWEKAIKCNIGYKAQL